MPYELAAIAGSEYMCNAHLQIPAAAIPDPDHNPYHHHSPNYPRHYGHIRVTHICSLLPVPELFPLQLIPLPLLLLLIHPRMHALRAHLPAYRRFNCPPCRMPAFIPHTPAALRLCGCLHNPLFFQLFYSGSQCVVIHLHLPPFPDTILLSLWATP